MSQRFTHEIDHSPAFKLLRSRQARFILGFFHDHFKEPNVALIPEEDLEVALEHHLEELRALDPDSPQQGGRYYLNLWCGDDHGFLRKVYSEEKESYVFLLTPHTERALLWVNELLHGSQRGYASAESRFSKILDGMRELSRGTNTDPQVRLRELQAERDQIDTQIERIRQTGKVKTMPKQKVKDRVHDLIQMTSSFLSDFRAIEENFKQQAKEIHQLHLEKQLSKGDLVAHALDAEEELRHRDQGRSYYGFRALVRSVESREELRRLVSEMAALAEKQSIDSKLFEGLLPRLYHEVSIVQESYRRISGQLRRIVEEQIASQTRFLLDSIGEVRTLAYRLREETVEGHFLHWEENLRLNNLMELGFYEPPSSNRFQEIAAAQDEDHDALRSLLQKVGKPLDLPRFRRRIEAALETQPQISLREMLERHPVEDAAADLVCYLVVAAENEAHFINPKSLEEIDLNRPLQPRFAQLEQITYHRS
jgi:hypothetical protein